MPEPARGQLGMPWKRPLEPPRYLNVPERDIVGAKKIGMKTAFARYGDTFGTKNSGADWDLVDIYHPQR